MQVIVALALLVAVATAMPADLFQKFMQDYNKVYSSPQEQAHRFKVFQQTLARIEKLNADEPYRPHGINQFADLTSEEFAAKYLMKKEVLIQAKAALADAPKTDTSKYTYDLPTNWNWATNASVVTPVKNQEQCGSCWAFSATENIESVWALAGNPIVQLAPQQIVDCDTVDDGCDGGWPQGAYNYVMSAGGLELETSYPYTGEDGTCVAKKSLEVADIKGYTIITDSGNESALAPGVYNDAPLSICVDAITWQTYVSGIITKNCAQQLDHCVQLTGWQADGKTPYWIVRNSWGTTWGNAGYIYVEQGKNLCGIADLATTTHATN